MKYTWIGILAFAALLSSCDKGDQRARDLYRGDGRWSIDRFEVQTFDEFGNMTGDYLTTDLGEIIFYRTGSIDALYDYYPAMINLTKNDPGYRVWRIEYYNDGDRFDILFDDGQKYQWLEPLCRTYSVEKHTRNTFILVSIAVDTNRPYTQQSITTITRLTITKE